MTPGTEKNQTGLTYHEAKKRQEIYGKNILRHKKKRSWIVMLLSQFTDFMVLVLLGATALSMIMGEITEALTILAIVLLNSLLGFYQEIHTEKTMEALARVSSSEGKGIQG
jgi:Ca2+-transporting ATPase